MGESFLIRGILCGIFVAMPSQAPGQTLAPPSVSHCFPMGAKAGSTFELKVTGQDLVDIVGLHFNFSGVKAEMLGSEKVLLAKKGKPASPLTTHKFKVTLPANAPLGIQDLRLVSGGGISNPRAFVIGDLKEFAEIEPNDDVPQAQRIELNSTVNGVIATPTDVDFYVFHGKKGQRVVCSCLTTSIDSKLRVALQLYGADGRYLGTNRSYANEDAVLDAVMPTDGEYFVRVFCFSYSDGGTDHFYRLTVSAAPWIDAIFPPVIEPGKEADVTVFGRNLPGGKVQTGESVDERPVDKVVVHIKAPGDAMSLQRLAYSGFTPPRASMIDGFEFRIKNEVGASNPFLLTYARAPVVIEKGDNDTKETAQKVTLPCVIAGRIEKKADRDWYAFAVKKGQAWNIEAFAERIGAPMDLLLQIRDPKGSLIVEQDDSPEILSLQFYTRSDDPQRFRFVAPADGTYYLVVTSRDAFTAFGPRHLYSVHITPEEPDFRLVAMPSGPLAPEGNLVHQGGGAAYNVYVWRLGGFNGAITLSGSNLSPGLSIPPQLIAPGQKQSVIVVQADPEAKISAGPIKIVGTANVKGQKLVREVRGATISWPVAQINTPTITRLDRELVLAVRQKAPFRIVLGTSKISVLQGEKITIPVSLISEGDFKTPVQLAVLSAPAGLASPPLTLTGNAKGIVTIDPKGGQPVAPGNYTLFVRGQTQPVTGKQPQKGGTLPNIVQVSMPVMLTIVPKQIAKLTVSPGSAKVQIGSSTEITVRANRTYDLPIAFQVEAIVPPNIKGLDIKESTLKADEDQAKLLITALPGAVAGSSASITIRATALFNGTTPIIHETKLTLTVMK